MPPPPPLDAIVPVKCFMMIPAFYEGYDNIAEMHITCAFFLQCRHRPKPHESPKYFIVWINHSPFTWGLCRKKNHIVKKWDIYISSKTLFINDVYFFLFRSLGSNPTIPPVYCSILFCLKYFPSLSFILKTNIFTVQNGNVYISGINHTGILSALLSMKYNII